MKIKDIFNTKNIVSFVEGNYKYALDKFKGSKEHIKEQVYYRMYICKDSCVVNNRCDYCGCPPGKKAFVRESCNNSERFPDLMSKKQWDSFKEEKEIDIEYIKETITELM